MNWANVWCTSDLIAEQCEHMWNLRNEIKRLNNNGLSDIIVMFIKETLITESFLNNRIKLSNLQWNNHHQNVRSLYNKLTYLKCTSPNWLYVVLLVFTETWINYYNLALELGLDDYVIYKYDRNSCISWLFKGDGVLNSCL